MKKKLPDLYDKFKKTRHLLENKNSNFLNKIPAIQKQLFQKLTGSMEKDMDEHEKNFEQEKIKCEEM